MDRQLIRKIVQSGDAYIVYAYAPDQDNSTIYLDVNCKGHRGWIVAWYWEHHERSSTRVVYGEYRLSIKGLTRLLEGFKLYNRTLEARIVQPTNTDLYYQHPNGKRAAQILASF